MLDCSKSYYINYIRALDIKHCEEYDGELIGLNLCAMIGIDYIVKDSVANSVYKHVRRCNNCSRCEFYKNSKCGFCYEDIANGTDKII